MKKRTYLASDTAKREICAALKGLMAQKPLTKITINDIAEDCGINRMTFYYHFKDIYDLVEWSCLEDAKRALDEKKTYETWQQGFLQIFEAVQENKPFILNAYRCISREQMEQFESLAKLLSDGNDKYLRLAAEYDNYRKRTAKEKESLYADAKIDTIKALLGVYDNLERGLAQYGDEESPHRKGLEMVFNQFKESLKKLGVETMDAAGKPFDPEKHNAVMHVEDENYGENTVVEVLQQGFTLGDKVLRFAIVKVAN